MPAKVPSPPQLDLLSQPFEGRSLGASVLGALQSGAWQRFRCAVAFLKHSGLRQLAGPLDGFLRQPGAQAAITVGIDHNGTSLEGLQDLWRVVDGRAPLYVFKEGEGGQARTFHPKAYLFERPRRALAILGSGNLTAGGLFQNHELAVAIELDLADRRSANFHQELSRALELWQTPGPACRRVDAQLLHSLYASGELLTERAIAAGHRAEVAATRSARAAGTAGRPALFGASGALLLAPTPYPLPPMASAAIVPDTSSRTPARVPGRRPGRRAPQAAAGQHGALLIEVRPQHNAEVFLSKLAVNEDPGFFGFPFSGWTTPKRTNNPPYPERSPDPHVELILYDRRGKAGVPVTHFLNMVFYDLKSEIRITLPSSFAVDVPPMSLLAMTRNPSAQYDYRLEFFPPSCTTPQVESLRAKLIHRLPSGGAPERRHYGWA
jgi:HKD family nuclease